MMMMMVDDLSIRAIECFATRRRCGRYIKIGGRCSFPMRVMSNSVAMHDIAEPFGMITTAPGNKSRISVLLYPFWHRATDSEAIM